jgi:hypothetical protein
MAAKAGWEGQEVCADKPPPLGGEVFVSGSSSEPDSGPSPPRPLSRPPLLFSSALKSPPPPSGLGGPPSMSSSLSLSLSPPPRPLGRPRSS